MSRSASNKPAAKKSGSSMLMGILLGMILGVALAAGLAWYLLKSPSPFVNKEQNQTAEVIKPDVVEPVKPKPVEQPASGVEDAKPRFEFYKVLTDKSDAANPKPDATAPKPETSNPAPEKRTESKPFKPVYLQAGAFSNASDAENLKAILAMKGLEASVQTVTVEGHGQMHRVRVGPFQSEQELKSARSTLKQSGFEAAPSH